MHLKKFAKIISYLFVPPVLNFLIFIYFSIYFEQQKKWISIFISFLLGLVIPVFAFIYFRKKGKIVNDDATIKEERTIPYIYAILFTISGLVISSLFHLNIFITKLWLIYLICSILIININRFWKISAHTMGAGMPLGASLFIDQTWLFLIIMILVGTSRYILKVHTILQILLGGFIGFITSFLILKYCN